MRVKSAKYIGSFDTIGKCPQGDKPEFAFIGRSNVGKSSMINMLTGQNALAKVSKSPGKTKMINYFLINDLWYLVDLPGFGYAKVSKKIREEFSKRIRGYLSKREVLYCTFMLIDVSIPPQKIDIDFINWMGQNQVPFIIVFTKSDKTKKSEIQQNKAAFEEKMLESWEEIPHSIMTSSSKIIGKDDLLNFITDTIS